MRTTRSKKSYTHVTVISVYFESKLSRSRTSKLTKIQNICIIMNYQTVRQTGFHCWVRKLRFQFWVKPKSVSETAAVSSFGLTQKWKLRTRFQFRAVSTFVPAQLLKRSYDDPTSFQGGDWSFKELKICP